MIRSSARSLPPPAHEALSRLARLAATALRTRHSLALSRDGSEPTIAHHTNGPEIELGEEVAQALLSLDRPLVVRDAHALSDGVELRLAKALGARAFVCTPFSEPTRRRTGTVMVWDAAPRAWAPDDVSLLEEFASAALSRWALLEEVQECERREKELRLLQSMTESIVAAPDVETAVRICLRRVCEFTGWEYGEAWVPDEHNERLVPAPGWFAAKDDRFTRASRAYSFARGTGLPGRVWVSQQPIWERDLSKAVAYVRTELAAASGIFAGVGIPVIFDGVVVAVLVFHASSLGEEDRRLTTLISTVASQLGGVVRAKQAEDARREADRRLRGLFDATYQFIGLLSPDGLLLDVNRTALRFAGIDIKEVVGRPFAETPWWSEPAARAQLEDGLRRAASGEVVRFETTHDNGANRVVVDFSLSPVHDEEGNILFLVPEGRDITARREAEDRLRISERRFSGILALAADAIVSIDSSQTITLFNAAAERMFGFSAEEAIGQPLTILLPEDVRQVHEAHVRGFVASGPAARWMNERGGIRGRRKSGELFPAEASISRLQLGDEMVCTVVLRDVTERREAEKALQAAQRHLSSIIGDAADGIVEMSLTGHVTLANPAALTMLGRTADELYGRSFHELVHHSRADGAALPESEAPFMKAIREDSTVRTDQHVFWRSDGSVFPVEYSCKLHGDPEDRQGLVLTFRDVSERKRDERVLRTQALRDELTGLHNRRGFILQAQQIVGAPRAPGDDCVMFYIDLDEFKEINDVHGHPVGDEALIDVARLLRATFRESDVLARFGGDEFTVLATCSRSDSVETIRARLTAAVEAHNAKSNRPYRLSLSIGACRYDAQTASQLGEMMLQADQALLEVKRTRKNVRPR